jgi:hypothetical protein
MDGLRPYPCSRCDDEDVLNICFHHSAYHCACFCHRGCCHCRGLISICTQLVWAVTVNRLQHCSIDVLLPLSLPLLVLLLLLLLRTLLTIEYVDVHVLHGNVGR